MMRYGGHRAALGPRRVQKKADGTADVQPAQLRAQCQEMIVLYPEKRLAVS